jgi:CBS domain-containing protein
MEGLGQEVDRGRTAVAEVAPRGSTAVAVRAIVCYVETLSPRFPIDGAAPMKVSDILRVKGNTLFTVSPDSALAEAVTTMAEHDIGSLVVMDHGDLTGMLTFREVIRAVVRNGGQVGTTTIRSVMDDAPLTCTPETEIDEVRRMMLGRHARYMPVLNGKQLMGVVSFYDVARTVVEAQDFENRMLKAYIRDWPAEEEVAAAAVPPHAKA